MKVYTRKDEEKTEARVPAKRSRRSRLLHKYGGLTIALSVIVFAVSGIMLNHREWLDSHDVDRSMLPSHYAIHHYNHGTLRGATPYADSQILYGIGGVWSADTTLRSVRSLNDGLPPQVAARNVRALVVAPDSTLYCITPQALYRRHGLNGRWQSVNLPADRSKLADLTLSPDSARLMLLTRSNLYSTPLSGSVQWQRELLILPQGYVTKTTLFKTMHELHSGAIAGLGGRLVVDAVGVLLIFLSVSGIVIWLMPKSIRVAARQRMQSVAKTHGRALRWNLRHHRRLGYVTIGFTLLITVTGLALRPPLMLPVVLTRVESLPWEDTRNQDGSENPWHERLRSIAWDAHRGRWLLHTTEGFALADSTFTRALTILPKTQTPPVSPMNLTVLRQQADGQWIVGSFSGLYRWDMDANTTTDWFSGKRYDTTRRGRPISDHLIEGAILYRGTLQPLDHYDGNATLPSMPVALQTTPISLWSLALELHTGRLFAGDWSDLYLILAGSMLLAILITGLRLRRRTK